MFGSDELEHPNVVLNRQKILLRQVKNDLHYEMRKRNPDPKKIAELRKRYLAEKKVWDAVLGSSNSD